MTLTSRLERLERALTAHQDGVIAQWLDALTADQRAALRAALGMDGAIAGLESMSDDELGCVVLAGNKRILWYVLHLAARYALPAHAATPKCPTYSPCEPWSAAQGALVELSTFIGNNARIPIDQQTSALNLPRWRMPAGLSISGRRWRPWKPKSRSTSASS